MRQALLLVPLVAAGCASGSGNPATARFIPQSNIIMVAVSDPEPARAIKLVSPTGEVTRATSVTTDQAGDQGSFGGGPPVSMGFGYGTGFGWGGGWGSGWGSGIGIGVPLSGGGPGFGGGVRSSATILVEHPDDYRQNWRDYRIVVDLGDPPDSHTVTVNAPEPPAPS